MKTILKNKMILPKNDFLKARDFILTNARMIERRLFEFHFANGDINGVYHAIYAARRGELHDVEITPNTDVLELKISVGLFSKSLEWKKIE